MNLRKIYYLDGNEINAEFQKIRKRSMKSNIKLKRLELANEFRSYLPQIDSIKFYDKFEEMVRSEAATFTKAILDAKILFDFENIGDFYDDLVTDMVEHFKISDENCETKDDFLAHIVIYLHARGRLDEVSMQIVDEIDDDAELSFNIFLEAYNKRHEDFSYDETYESFNPSSGVNTHAANHDEFMDGLTLKQKSALADCYEKLAELSLVDGELTVRQRQDEEYYSSTIEDLKRMGMKKLEEDRISNSSKHAASNSSKHAALSPSKQQMSPASMTKFLREQRSKKYGK